jgi:hypothetical protein
LLSLEEIENCKLKIANFKLPSPPFAICNLQFAFCNTSFAQQQSRFYVGGRVAVFALCMLTVTTARADVFELEGGGRVEGRLAKGGDANKSEFVIDLEGGGRLTIPRTRIARIDTTLEIEAEYERLARTAPDTVDAHWKLVEWCRERKLRGEAQRHLARILELDPDHEAARAALGFRQKDGEWMNRDDVMASRGLVLYEGRYVTPQHIELMERQKGEKLEQADWSNKIKTLRRKLTSRRQDDVATAQAELRALQDPAAAEAIVEVLRREQDPQLKRLWLEVASRMDHPAAVDALVDLSLSDPDPEVRRDCLDVLVDSGRRGLATPYVRALRDSDNEIVNRAGEALGQIGDRDAIGPLIDALLTKHKFKVGEGNADQHAYTFTPDSNAFSFGGSAPKIVTDTVRNPAVLSALVTLSGGTSFDYDQSQWRRWLAAQAKANAVDVRRDQ